MIIAVVIIIALILLFTMKNSCKKRTISDSDVHALLTINIKPDKQVSKKSYGELVPPNDQLNELDYYDMGYDIIDKRPEFTMAEIVEKNHILGRTSSSHSDALNIEIENIARPRGSRMTCRETERDGYCNR